MYGIGHRAHRVQGGEEKVHSTGYKAKGFGGYGFTGTVPAGGAILRATTGLHAREGRARTGVPRLDVVFANM